MEPGEILTNARNLERLDFTARRNYGLDEQLAERRSLSLEVLTTEGALPSGSSIRRQAGHDLSRWRLFRLSEERKRLAPNKAPAERKRRAILEPASGTVAPPITSVKVWFAPVPQLHTYVPGVTPRLAKVALF